MLHDTPLAAAVDDLRRGRTDPVEYADRQESSAATVEPEIHAFVSESDRWTRVRKRAAEVANRQSTPAPRPPLYGVPVGVKDIFHVDGLATRAGSDLPAEVLSGPQGPAVSRLADAGAVVLGKTVTAEFAYFEPGPTRNPHDTQHTPGGSSSGSAAAVAAGLCPLALGTQTIGSISRPAAFCGVVGVKPSYGRIPTDGVIPSSPSVDTVGYFTQDVAGAHLAADVLCEEWRTLPTPRDRPTLGVPAGPYLDQASDTGQAAFEDHVDRLASAGYDIERVPVLENVAAVNERHEQLVAAEMAMVHEEWFSEYADRYADATRELVERGREVTAGEIARGRRGREALRTALETAMEKHGVDIWISPSAPGPAPAGIDTTGDPVMNLPWTHAGLPTVSLPAGKTDAGLPVGLQCATWFGGDEDLLAWADGIAAALNTGL
ncbi:amidase [Salinibaculum salinum]|uniref:amidase n=1 Tax=Salinibaculum salinum TaxID=3131996 RepID=UPI0030EDD108